MIGLSVITVGSLITCINRTLKFKNNVLNEGSLIIIFPEGTRNNNRCMPKGVFHPFPLICSVIFGEPLHFVKDETKSDFLIRARQSIINLKVK